ncbi:hypothetical protein Bca52824_004002 [Brassica carinata]|uniref:Exostosin GT47 domain-containing protein n=1 Tax=Brassica carinata TaxID=52824 RepID=A0A8X7WNV6_BRACI|nr:hypothetical protein Bca52824_004002 [Brassica carinata]
MCKYLDNFGFGPQIGDAVSVDSRYSRSWYATNQFTLEVIFHEKMKRYECLNRNSSLASAFYIPYYAGLDYRRNRWRNVAERDAAGKEMFKWLTKQPQWKGMSGKDHFLVIGRISRDFRRNSDNVSVRGTNLILLPESQNLTFLTIERSPTSHNEFAILYPTYFHPTSTVEIRQWQDKIKLTNRTILFSFAGARRPIRSQSELRTGGKRKIEEILRGIPNERIIGMRENVIRLVPKIVYTKSNRYKRMEKLLKMLLMLPWRE